MRFSGQMFCLLFHYTMKIQGLARSYEPQRSSQGYEGLRREGQSEPPRYPRPAARVLPVPQSPDIPQNMRIIKSKPEYNLASASCYNV